MTPFAFIVHPLTPKDAAKKYPIAMDVYTSGVIVGIGRSISVGLLLLSLGCGTPKEWIGTWSGSHSVRPVPGTDPRWAKEYSAVKVRLHSNGRFELVESSIPHEGTFSTNDDEATLTIKTMAGRDQPDRPVAKLIKTTGGALLYQNPNGLTTGEILLTPETQPAEQSVRKQ